MSLMLLPAVVELTSGSAPRYFDHSHRFRPISDTDAELVRNARVMDRGAIIVIDALFQRNQETVS